MKHFTHTFLLALILFFAGAQALRAQCTANAGPDETLNCFISTVVLQGSSNIPGATYAWAGPGITALNQNLQNPQVSDPGTYTLIITNPADGCTATDQTTISQDIVVPTVSIAPPPVLTCFALQVTLVATGSNGPQHIYQWNGPDILTGNASPTPVVAAPGVYTVIVTDIQNGCTAVQSVVVNADFAPPIASVQYIQPLGCGNPEGIIGTFHVPNGTYLWSNNAVTPEITVNTPGAYCVTVTNTVNGCTASACLTVAQSPPVTVTVVNINPASCNNADGSVVMAASGGTPPYTFQWSNNTTTPAQQGLLSGVYSLTVTDANGCTTSTFVNITSQALPPASISFCDGYTLAQPLGGTPPFSFQWKDLADNSLVGNSASGLFPPGAYELTLSDFYGCSATQTVIVSPNPVPCTRIQGFLRDDANSNCDPETAELGLANIFVRAESPGATYYGYTDSTGYYVIRVEPGNYNVSPVLNGQIQVCQPAVPVTLAQSGDSTQVDFAVQNVEYCPSMEVSISAPVLRRCFSNNFYYIKYANKGTLSATDAYVVLTLDPAVELLEASKSYALVGINQYRFDLGTVPSAGKGNFYIRVKVSCDAALGQTHCTEAHIYPDSSCTPVNPLWSGASLNLNAVCAGDSLNFVLKNVGLAPMTNPLSYVVIEDGIMARQGIDQPLSAGNSMIIRVPANGSTWRLEAQQEPYHPGQSYPMLSIEGCTTNGNFTTGFINQFPVNDANQPVDIDCTQNIGSYDPNDKQGFPTGFGPQHYILPGTGIEYLVRFQNTGTDTAFNVVIRDTLSTWFDPATIEPGASSHPYRFEFGGEGILVFDFQNILLPDSNVNEAASHGFVRFRIAPRADVPLETDLFNRAAIFFDYNAPVITNTTVHRIGQNFVVSSWEPRQPNYTVSVAPHPLQSTAQIKVAGVPENGNYRLLLFDLTGRPLRSLDNTEPQFLLRKEHLPDGLYLFRIEKDGVWIGTGKLVAQE